MTIKRHLLIGISIILSGAIIGAGLGYWFGMRQMDVLYATMKPSVANKPLPNPSLGITPEGVPYTESLIVDLSAIEAHLNVFERLEAVDTEADKRYDYWMSQIESQRPVILRAGPTNATYVRYQTLRAKYPEWFTPVQENVEASSSMAFPDGLPKVSVPETPDGINF